MHLIFCWFSNLGTGVDLALDAQKKRLEQLMEARKRLEE